MALHDSARTEKSAPLLFAAITLLTAGAAFALGWATDLRAVMHTGLLVIGGLALLPFAVLLALLGVALVLTLLIAVFGAVSGGAAEATGHLVYATAEAGLKHGRTATRLYYQVLGKRLHSPWFGVPAGIVLGCIGLWVALLIFVVPHETETVRRLLQAQAHIEEDYRVNGHYPKPVDGAYIDVGAPWSDDFGRRGHYQVEGHWKLSSYQLRSFGADGVRSSDDLCVEGRTKLQRAMEGALSSVALLELLRTGQARWSDRLASIRAASCED